MPIAFRGAGRVHAIECFAAARLPALAVAAFALALSLPLVSGAMAAAPCITIGGKRICLSGNAASSGCRSWLKRSFWKRATARDVRRCIAAGSRADPRNGAPLMLAAGAGNAVALKVLLAAGAKANRRSRSGLTALHFATANVAAPARGRVEMVKALLGAGARTDIRGRKNGWTPLHLAAIRGHAQVAKILLAAGADRRVRDRKGRTALSIARASNRRRTAQLLAGTATTGLGRSGRAAQSGPPGCRGWLTADFWRRAGAADVKRCLTAGMKLDARTGRGSTALHWAAYVNNATAVKALIAAGAKADARDGRNRTPAHSAAAGGASAAAKALIDAGADTGARSNAGQTPAEEARRAGRAQVASLYRNAELGAETAERDAAEGPKTDTAPAEGGSPPPEPAGRNTAELPPADGAQPGEDAAAPPPSDAPGAGVDGSPPPETRKEVARAALDNVPKDAARAAANTAESPASTEARSASTSEAKPDRSCSDWLRDRFWAGAGAADVERCLGAGMTVGARTAAGRTPLHAAAFAGSGAGIAALLAAGAAIDARDKQEATPLHRAAAGGHAAAVDALLAEGADAAAKDKDGRTPFLVARQSGTLKGTEVLGMLKEAQSW